MSDRFDIIIQARMSSSRLPGKILLRIGNSNVLELIIRALQKINSDIRQIIVATTTSSIDDQVINECKKLDVSYFRGDENDVLSRIYSCAKKIKSENIIRITADCPLIDYRLIMEGINLFKKNKYDYVSNTIERTYPDGLDFEIFTFKALEISHKKSKHKYFREHVTPYMSGKYPKIGKGNFKIGQLVFKSDFSHIRWTLDTKDDYKRINKLFLSLNDNFTWLHTLSVSTKRPELLGNSSNGLIEDQICFESIEESHANLLYEWVNSKSSLKNKKSTNSKIEFKAHKEWLLQRINSDFAKIWIILLNEKPIGQARLELNQNKEDVFVDIFIDSVYRGKGYASKAIKELIIKFKNTFPEKNLKAIVKEDNENSINLFIKSNFLPFDYDGNFLHFTYIG